jgi:MFS family permease
MSMIQLPALAVAARPPRVEDLAILFGFDSAVRGLLMSVTPLVLIDAWVEGTLVSLLFLGAGILSLMAGLCVPWLTRHLARSRLMTAAGILYLAGMGLFMTGERWLVAAALVPYAVATVTFWVVVSAYVLDWIPREDLGRMESKRLLYGAAAWTFGPLLGVLLWSWWRPAPFLLAGLFALLLMATFWGMRMGDGKPVGAASGEGPALAFVGRFLARPRLVAGWLFATIRSCGWWIYIVYLPYFCIRAAEEGRLDPRVAETLGGAAVSASSALLFATPILLRLTERLGVRGAVRGAFAWCALFFALAWGLSSWPWATVGALVLASAGLVMLDVCGSLPFLMAVKPSERTEMAAVYSSFRDVSGILSPLVGGAILLVAPVTVVFAATGAAMAAAAGVAGRLHPRLGRTGARRDAR